MLGDLKARRIFPEQHSVRRFKCSYGYEYIRRMADSRKALPPNSKYFSISGMLRTAREILHIREKDWHTLQHLGKELDLNIMVVGGCTMSNTNPAHLSSSK